MFFQDSSPTSMRPIMRRLNSEVSQVWMLALASASPGARCTRTSNPARAAGSSRTPTPMRPIRTPRSLVSSGTRATSTVTLPRANVMASDFPGEAFTAVTN